MLSKKSSSRNLFWTLRTLVQANMKSSSVYLEPLLPIETFVTQITFYWVHIGTQLFMPFKIASSFVIVSTFFTLKSSLSFVFCHVRQSMLFILESPKADIAAEMISVHGLIVEENFLFAHSKNTWAATSPPVVAVHVLLEVVVGAERSFAHLATVHV